MNKTFSYEEVTNAFLEIESKYNLFDLKEHNVYIWKLIRFEVFQKIIMHKQNIKQIHLEESKSSKYKRLFPMLINSLTKNPFFGSVKRMVVLDHPRKIKFNHTIIEPYTHHFLVDRNKDEYELLERRYVGSVEKNINSTNSSMDFFVV